MFYFIFYLRAVEMLRLDLKHAHTTSTGSTNHIFVICSFLNVHMQILSILLSEVQLTFWPPASFQLNLPYCSTMHLDWSSKRSAEKLLHQLYMFPSLSKFRPVKINIKFFGTQSYFNSRSFAQRFGQMKNLLVQSLIHHT